MNEHTYCSILSKQREDYLPGSASHYNKLLLVEYNKPWTQKAFIDSKINSVVKKHLADFISLNNIKLFLVKNQHSNETGIRIFTFNLDQDKNYFNSFFLKRYEDLLALNLDSYFESHIQAANEILYLVCTNGKKDKCCSKFGLPVYYALAKRNKNVWQCTHVGGDRFAPNILVLPHSLFFGHIAVNEIPDFIKTTESNEIYPAKYRGRSIYTNYEQAAEYFLLRHLDNFSIDEFKLVSSQKINTHKSTVLFCSRSNNLSYQVDVKKELSHKAEFLTCTAEKAGHVPVFKLLSIQQKEI